MENKSHDFQKVGEKWKGNIYINAPRSNVALLIHELSGVGWRSYG